MTQQKKPERRDERVRELSERELDRAAGGLTTGCAGGKHIPEPVITTRQP